MVKHHKANYNGQFPIWVMIEFFSIGMLSYFYKDMLAEDKKAVAAQMSTVPKNSAIHVNRKLFTQLLVLKYIYPVPEIGKIMAFSSEHG